MTRARPAPCRTLLLAPLIAGCSVPATREVIMSASNSIESAVMQTHVIGSGPPLVLIGGGLTGWKSWEPHAERLAAARTVARLQLLSVQYGLEDRPLPERYSVRLESDALERALDALGWRGAVDLVAWSYGAVITLDFALRNIDRVRTLTLIEPPATWVLPDRGAADAGVIALRGLAADIGDDVDAAHLERFVRTAALAPPDASPQSLPQWPLWLEHRRSLRSTAAPFDHHDDVERLRRFDRPVLLVTGTGTAEFLRRIHDSLAAALPQAHTVELPGGHAPQLAAMDRFLEELDRFHAAAQPAAGEARGPRASPARAADAPPPPPLPPR